MWVYACVVYVVVNIRMYAQTCGGYRYVPAVFLYLCFTFVFETELLSEAGTQQCD